MTTKLVVLAIAAFAATPGAAHAQQAAGASLEAAPRIGADTDDSALLRRARDAMMNAGDYTAALTPAESLVNRESAAQSSGYTNDLTALARIRAELGDYDLAEGTYLQAIDAVESAEGEFSITLVEPYHGLGRTYIKSARYPEAITALEQAQHITQRNLGLFNVEQAAVLDDITTAYLGLGDTIEARKLQLERLDNAIKRFGESDPRVFPYRYQLANYYQRSRMTVSAREQYAEVLKAQEQQVGTNHPSLLAPLRQLVRVDLQMTQGEESGAHARLSSILAESGEIEPVERGLSLAVLGDWATVTGDPVAARNYYMQAWETLSGAEQIDVESYFAKPAMIDFIAPLTPVDRGTQSKPYAWGSMVFEFDLTAEGRPTNVTTVGPTGAAATLASRYTRRLRETHFRPRLVAGQPVPTEGVQFTHYFRFYVDEDDRAPDEPG